MQFGSTLVSHDPDVRFWAKVKKTRGCWVWTSSQLPHGYGTFSFQSKKVLAHRWIYERKVGPIPPGMQVLHNCDNPSCVRPSHLFLGTHSDNMTDCARKRRGNTVKLTQAEVRRVRSFYKRGGISQEKLAEQFGVCQTSISAIIHRRSWRHT